MLFTLLLLNPEFSSAQMCSPFPGYTCESAPVLCHPMELNRYQCQTLPTPNMGGTGDGEPCGDIDPNNISFLNFIATGNTMTMQIVPFNCMNRMGNVGFQVALYPACNFNGMPVFCKTACNEDPVNMLLTNMSACYEYTLVIDGCEGTICDYTIQVGYSEPPLINGVFITGPDETCVGREMCFETGADWGQNGGSFNCFPDIFTWYLDGEEIAADERFPCFEFEEEGVFELCVVGSLETGCATPDESCKTITVTRPPDQRLPRRVICYEYQPFTWLNGLLIDQSGTYSTELQDGSGCLYTVIGEFILAEEPQYGFEREIICGQDPPHVGPDGNLYPFAGFYALTLSRQNFQGCDSLMDYELVYLDVLFDLEANCRDGAMWIKPDSLEIVPIDTNVVFEWYRQSDQQVIGRGDSISVLDSGTYCVDITMTHLAESCTMSKCIKIPLFRPEVPTLVGETLVCNESPYVLTASACMDTCSIIWEVPPTIPILSSTGGQIELDLSDESNSTVLICARSANDCGVSEKECIEIEVVSGPSAQAGPDQIICGSLQATLSGNSVTGATGIWSGPATFSDVNDPSSEVNVDGYGTYTFTWTLQTLDCESVDEVSIEFIPPLSIDAALDTCDLENADLYNVNATIAGGAGNYQLISGAGMINPVTGEFESDAINSGDSYTFVFEDDKGCTITLTGMHSCTCFGEPAVISIPEDEYCEADCFDVSITQSGAPDQNDIGHFILHTSPAPAFGNIIQSNIGATICYSNLSGVLSIGETYYLTYLFGNESNTPGTIDLDDPCLKYSNSVPFTFIEGPIANAVNPPDTCDLRSVLNALPSNGTGKWEYNGAVVGVSLGSPNNQTTTVTVPTAGNYSFNWIEDNGACADTATISLNFSLPPSFSGLEVECAPDLTNYTISGVIEGDGNPFQVHPSSTVGGTINQVGSQFIFESDQITNGSSYRIVIIDNKGCSVIIAGQYECDCGNNQAGSMSQDTLEACVDTELTATLVNNPSYDPNTDTIRFILHEGNGLILVNQITSNTTGTFGFVPGQMIFNKVYYISIVVGRKNANGELDFSDPCLRIAQGQPIRFLPTPDPRIDTDLAQCSPDGFLSVQSAINGQWTQISGPGNAFIEMPGQNISRIDITETGTYRFVFLADNGFCVGSDTVDVVFSDYPEFANISSIVCDSVAESYKVVFEVSGGLTSSIVLTGQGDDGMPYDAQSTGPQIYESEWIPSAVSVDWILYDNIGCDTSSVVTDNECDCITASGVWVSGDLNLCIDDIANPAWDDQSGTLDPNDALIFYLWTADPSAGGMKIDSSDFPPSFSFDPSKGMVAGQTYYIQAITANQAGNSIDWSDRCLEASSLISVTFWDDPLPQIIASDLTITCEISEIQLNASGSSSASGSNLEFEWSSPTVGIPPNQINNPILEVTSEGTYCVLVTDPLSGCTASECIDIDQDQSLPQIVLGQPDTITCLVDQVQLDATGSSNTSNIVFTWGVISGPGVIVSGSNTLMPSVNGPGVYELTLTDTETQCEVKRTVTVAENTELPSIAITPPAIFNCQADTLQLSIDANNTDPGLSLTWKTNNGNIIGSNNQTTTQIDMPGTYRVIGYNPNNGCSDSVDVIVNQLNARPDVNVDVSSPLCEGETNGRIILLPNSSPFTIMLNGTVVSRNELQQLGSGSYQLSIEDASGCELDTVVVVPAAQDRQVDFPASIGFLFNEQVNLTNLLSGINGQEIQRIDWYGPDGMIISNPLNITIEGVYSFVLIDINGCEHTGEIMIRIRKDESIFVPNAFTPNNDGVNDVFKPSFESGGITVRQFAIFNRWGDMVYSEGGDIRLDALYGWDGRFGSTLADPAVYVYRIHLQLPDGSEQIMTGDVTLIR